MKGIWQEILGQEAEAKDKHKPNTSESEIGIDQILSMRLSELSRRNIALRIYSEVLGCEIWVCGNGEMTAQLKQDDTGAVVYTANEMRKLMSLKPDSQGLRNVHIAKTVFPESKIVDSKLKETNDKAEDAQNDRT